QDNRLQRGGNLRVQFPGRLGFLFQNQVDEQFFHLAVKGQFTGVQQVHEHPDGPNVAAPLALTHDLLRGHEGTGTHHGGADVLFPKILAAPKSRSFRAPSGWMMMLLGLMSRCMTRWRWAWETTSMSCKMIRSTK